MTDQSTPSTPTTADPAVIAEEAAARYFAALAAEIPFDTAPGDVNLVEVAAVHLFQAVREHTPEPTDEFDCALRAGYLLGIAIGRRMGGAR